MPSRARVQGLTDHLSESAPFLNPFTESFRLDPAKGLLASCKSSGVLPIVTVVPQGLFVQCRSSPSRTRVQALRSPRSSPQEPTLHDAGYQLSIDTTKEERVDNPQALPYLLSNRTIERRGATLPAVFLAPAPTILRVAKGSSHRESAPPCNLVELRSALRFIEASFKPVG